MGLTDRLRESVPEAFRNTFSVRLLGLLKIRLLFMCSPRVLELSDERCAIELPLNGWTRNHLKSMYFGALACGADLAGGLIAWRLIEQSGQKVSLIFKDFHAEFLKRPEAATVFTCEDGAVVKALVARTLETGERQDCTVNIVATVPSRLGSEPVARFRLTLSLKAQGLAKS
jgi:hypothetical protein